MNLEVEKGENTVINPMEYDFGDISLIKKVSNGGLQTSDKVEIEDKEISSSIEVHDVIDTQFETQKFKRDKPYFYTDEVWNEYKLLFPWLYHSGKRFLCSYCEDAIKEKKDVIPTAWSSGCKNEVSAELPTKYNLSRTRFERHNKTLIHISATNFLNLSNNSSDWQNLKDKYKWLDGNIDNARCLFCEQAYKKHKSIMIVTIWTCPELKNEQSPTHFSISHRLDRHEKCKNHLLAVQLESSTNQINSPTILKSPSSRLSFSKSLPSKAPHEMIKRSRKSAPIKSCKPPDMILPTAISTQQYHILKSRYPWLLSHDESSMKCTTCPSIDCKIIFSRDSSLSFISRRILAHSHCEIHNRIHQDLPEGTCVTRLQRGVAPKIDYKRLSNGLNDVMPTIEITSPKKSSSRLSCPQCSSNFFKTSNLIEHISLCDSQSIDIVRELACPCNPQLYKFSSIIKLDLHAAQEHSNQSMFHCYICSDRFCRLLVLYEHMLVHHIITWDPYDTYTPVTAPPSPPQCVFCCTIFSTNADLSEHYCQSKCKQYLQPSILIEAIDVSHLTPPPSPTTSNIDHEFDEKANFSHELVRGHLDTDLLRKSLENIEADAKEDNLLLENTSKVIRKGIFEKLHLSHDAEDIIKSTPAKVNRRSVSADNTPRKRSRNLSDIPDKMEELSVRNITEMFRNLSDKDAETAEKTIEDNNEIVKEPKATKRNSLISESALDNSSSVLEDQPKAIKRRSLISESSLESSISIVKDQPKKTKRSSMISDSAQDSSISMVKNQTKTTRRSSLISESAQDNSSSIVKDKTKTTRRNSLISESAQDSSTSIVKDQTKTTRRSSLITDSSVKSDNSHMTRHQANLFANKSTDTPLRSHTVKVDDSNIQEKIAKRRNCRSLFSRQLFETETPTEKKKLDVNNEHIHNSTKKYDANINKETKLKRGKLDVNSNTISKSHRKIRKTVFFDEKVDTSKDLKESEKNNLEGKAEKVPKVKPINNESTKTASLEQKDKRKSLYFDKLKEMCLDFNLTSDHNTDNSNSPESLKVQKNLYSQKILELSAQAISNETKEPCQKIHHTEELNENVGSGIDKGFDVSLPKFEDKKHLPSQKSTENGLDQYLENTENVITEETDDKDDYEIISLDNAEKPEKDDEEPKEYCQEITLNELKVCIEKTDLLIEQKRLQGMAKKRKWFPLDNLRSNLCPNAISVESEKRIRIPSEKLRESSDYVERRRRRRRSTSERKSFIEESIEDFPVQERHRNTQRNIDSVNSMKNDLINFTNQNHHFTNRTRKMTPEKSKSVSEASIKSESKSITKSETKSISKSDEPVAIKQMQVNPELIQNKCPQLTNLLVDVMEEEPGSQSPSLSSLKKPILIQSQCSPPSKQMVTDGQDEQGIPAELSFMDRMKKIRQLKKIRTEQQREQMMAVDRTVAEINEKAMTEATNLAKSEKIQKLLNCEQYSMSDLKNILQDESKKRRSSDLDEYRSSKKARMDSPRKADLVLPLPPTPLPKMQRPEQQQRVQLPCDACQMVFKSLRARDKHVLEEHRGQKIFRCNVCELSLSTHLALRKHISKYHPVPGTGPQSLIGGAGHQDMAVHGPKSGTGNVGICQCHFCPVQCASKTALHNHVTTVHRSSQDKHRASLDNDSSCPVQVIDDFVARLTQADASARYQQCLACNEVVHNEFELAIHTVEHERENDANVEANQFACPKCCRLFFGREGKTYLKDHYNIIHLQKPVPSCDECGTEFPSTWCYYEHKRTQKYCAKKSIDQMIMSSDPYEPLNDPMRMAFVCSRCQSLVAGESAEQRFEQHQIDCSLQMAEEEAEVGEESLVMVVDESASMAMAAMGDQC